MKIFAATLALLACCAQPLRASTPADFAFTRPVIGTKLAAPQLIEVRLDAALMAETQAKFHDLRLYNAANQEIPRSVEPLFTTQERAIRHPLNSTPVSIQELP